MRRFLQITVTCLFSFAANAQQLSPGGVNAPVRWLIAEATASPAMRDQMPGKQTVPLEGQQRGISLLNGYPALAFNGRNFLQVDLTEKDLSMASYFTVYHAARSSSENIIWHLDKNHTPELVLTTSRMADLAAVRYMSFFDQMPLYPKVNSYVQQKQSDSTQPTSQIWKIGDLPSSPQLPVAGFNGLIPEIIVYDKALTVQEQIRISSYLALKYGITLSEPNATYLDSRGTEIWNGERYSQYHHNIAGIGRDDSSGLNQLISSSGNTPGLFVLSVNRSHTKDRSFLLWGDNGLSLMNGAKIPGIPLLVERKWRMVTTNMNAPLQTGIAVDVSQLDVPLPHQPVYWLAVDRSGTGKFPAASTEFIRMKKPVDKGLVNFEGIEVNQTAGINEVIGICIAQELLVSLDIESPTCSAPDSGNVSLKVWGGKAPFQIRLWKDDKALLTESFIDAPRFTAGSLSIGKYLLKLSDANGNRYTDEFVITNKDAPAPVDISSNYILQEGQRLNLNASTNMPAGLTYEWKGPDGFGSSASSIVVMKDGVYDLKISNDNCSSLQQFRVSRPPKKSLKSVQAYPNPSSGAFTVKVELDSPGPVRMNVITEDGKLIDARTLTGFANYTFLHQLQGNGVYYLVFHSGLSTITEKMIIVKP
ncbi:MAG: hypothetical protein DI535_18180 [Citrobacter freundii]|nr:MAG: hypothetical protein DI535_18180 [Citrobacter freundii]